MKCPYCNAEIEDHLVFCPSCGAKLVNEDAGSTQQTETVKQQETVKQPEMAQQSYNNDQQNNAGQQPYNNGQQNYAGQQPYNNGQQNYAGQQPYNNGQQNYAGQQPYNNGQQYYNGQPGYQQYGPDMMWPVKSKTAAGILGILLGDLGIHKFYLGNVGLGIVYLLFCWTGIPGIIGFIEGIIYLTSSRADFEMKNHVRCSDTSE